MEFATLTFWLLIIVFAALGVHQLWSSLVQPKVVNSILLPGTLVAQLGRVLGLLITGGTVQNTALIRDDDSGEPQTDDDPKSRVPIVGAVVIALLPMAGCAVAIYWVSRYLGSDILAGMSVMSVRDSSLPTSLPLFFGTVHTALGLVERLVAVIRSCDLTDWRTLLFLYLAICLSVRMAPLNGNVRGALGAIFIAGGLAFLIDRVTKSAGGSLSAVWPLVTFSAAVLLLLLILSLVIKGVVGVIKTWTSPGSA